MNENECRKSAPAINNKHAAVIIGVIHVFKGVAMLFEFFYTCINAADQLPIAAILAHRKTFLCLNRQVGKLPFKYLTGKARQGQVGIFPFALIVGPLDYISVCLFEIDIQRFIVFART